MYGRIERREFSAYLAFEWVSLTGVVLWWRVGSNCLVLSYSANLILPSRNIMRLVVNIGFRDKVFKKCEFYKSYIFGVYNLITR